MQATFTILGSTPGGETHRFSRCECGNLRDTNYEVECRRESPEKGDAHKPFGKKKGTITQEHQAHNPRLLVCRVKKRKTSIREGRKGRGQNLSIRGDGKKTSDPEKRLTYGKGFRALGNHDHGTKSLAD